MSRNSLPPFQRLVDEHLNDVWRLAVRLAGRQEAADVVQETFLSALRAYDSLRDGRNLRGWLLTIATNKATDEARSRSRRPLPSAELPERPTTIDGADGDASLWLAVRSLPPKQRTAVAHRFVADLDYAAIGAAMGTTTEAARRNVHEALTTLRKTWTR